MKIYNEAHLNILTTTKDVYINQIIHNLQKYIYEGILLIYREATVADKRNRFNLFKTQLSNIPKWNSVVIDDEYKRFTVNNNEKKFERLIRATFLTYTKILSSVKMNQKKQTKVTVVIPDNKTFIHNIFIETAREFYKNVNLLDHELKNIEKQHNLKESLLIINDSIKKCIECMLPIDDIISQNLLDDSDEESDSNEESESDDEESDIEEPDIEEPDDEEPDDEEPDDEESDYEESITEKQGDKSGIEVDRAQLKRAQLKRAQLERAEVERAEVERAEVERAEVERAEVERAEVERAEVERHGEKIVDITQSEIKEPDTIKQIYLNTGKVNVSDNEADIPDNKGNMSKSSEFNNEMKLITIKSDVNATEPKRKHFKKKKNDIHLYLEKYKKDGGSHKRDKSPLMKKKSHHRTANIIEDDSEDDSEDDLGEDDVDEADMDESDVDEDDEIIDEKIINKSKKKDVTFFSDDDY
jgi:hypothetical protein